MKHVYELEQNLEGNEKPFILKALEFFIPVYDFTFKHILKEEKFRDPLLEMSELTGNETVLDIGSGTGTYAQMMADQLPNGEVYGIDISEKMINYAQNKAEKAGYDINYQLGNATNLPFEDNSFDVVSSTLLFPYLDSQETIQTLDEVYRVLKPGGKFVSYDMVEFPSGFFFDKLKEYFGPEEGVLDGLTHEMVEKTDFTIQLERVGPKFKIFYDTKFFALEKSIE